MRLSTDDTTNLINILATCAVGGIESFIIDEGVVRGANAEKTFAIISNHNVPRFPQKIGLSRAGALKQRIEFFANGATIDARESERGEISALEIAAGKSKAQFRCTSTALIKAPKATHGTDPAFKVFFGDTDERKSLISAIKMMSAGIIQLIIRKDLSVEIKASDETNDSFSMVFSKSAEAVGEDQDSVVHYYHASTFLAVMRALASDVDVFTVGQVGTIQTEINGHNVIIIPRINTDEE